MKNVSDTTGCFNKPIKRNKLSKGTKCVGTDSTSSSATNPSLMSPIQAISMAYFNNPDERSFGKMVDAIKPGLVVYLKRYTSDYEVCEMIAIDTFMKVWSRPELYQPTHNFSSWAYKTASRQMLSHIGSAAVSRNVVVDGSDPINVNKYFGDHLYEIGECDEIPAEIEEQNMEELYKRTIDAIEQLKPKYRDVIYDRVIGRLKRREIAEKHSLNFNTVHTYIRIAEKALHKIITNDYLPLVEAFVFSKYNED